MRQMPAREPRQRAQRRLAQGAAQRDGGPEARVQPARVGAGAGGVEGAAQRLVALGQRAQGAQAREEDAGRGVQAGGGGGEDVLGVEEGKGGEEEEEGGEGEEGEGAGCGGGGGVGWGLTAAAEGAVEGEEAGEGEGEDEGEEGLDAAVGGLVLFRFVGLSGS